MCDFEHAVSPGGITEGYTFDQTESSIILTFPVPDDGIKPASVDVNINENEGTIRAGISNMEPAICGKLWGKIHKHSHVVQKGRCKIELHKVENASWDLLISKESMDGIDGKSLFVIGLKEEMSQHPREAWAYFKQSAAKGYVTAKVLIADSLKNDTNPYGVPKNEEKAIEILRSIPEERQSGAVLMTLADILLKIGKKEEAREVLTRAAKTKADARIALVSLLSTLPDPTGEIARERASHLQILSDDGDAMATHLLAKCYASGKGVQKDRAHAKSLAHKAHELDPSLPDAFEVSGIATNTAIAVGISLAFLGAALSIWHFRKR